MAHKIPAQPGSYVLLLKLPRERALRIGRRPRVYFPQGWYAYVGNARGPGGLKARLQRHLKPPTQKRLHWHIDFLLISASVQAAGWAVGNADLECRWARLMAVHGHPYPRAFGASDCRCRGHLLHFTKAMQAEAALQSLGELTQLVGIRRLST